MDSVDQSYHIAVYVPGGRWVVVFVSSLGFGEVRILSTGEMIAMVEALDELDHGD